MAKSRLERAAALEASALGMFQEAHDKLDAANALAAEQMQENADLIEVLQREQEELNAAYARRERQKTKLAEFTNA